MITIDNYTKYIFNNFPFDDDECIVGGCSDCRRFYPYLYLTCYLEKIAFDSLYFFN